MELLGYSGLQEKTTGTQKGLYYMEYSMFILRENIGLDCFPLKN